MFAVGQPIQLGQAVFGTTVGSTVEPGEPLPPSNTGTVWYTFTAPVDGYVSVQLQNFVATANPTLGAGSSRPTRNLRPSTT